MLRRLTLAVFATAISGMAAGAADLPVQSRLGAVAGQGEQLVGDGCVTLLAQGLELSLQSPHLGPQDGVLLGYSELRGCDDVTEQGLGHDCNGLSSEEGLPGAPEAGRRELWYLKGDRP